LKTGDIGGCIDQTPLVRLMAREKRMARRRKGGHQATMGARMLSQGST
jgi:hypothetical protein